MSAILYVEASMCFHTTAAGWGAVLARGPTPDQWASLQGPLPGDFDGAVTLMELAAAQVAAQGALARGLPGGRLALAMRSTAALAVLRWVFPDAPFDGVLKVERPKALKAVVRDFQPLYDLHDQVEAAGLDLGLRHVVASDYTDYAQLLARGQMEAGRAALRRRA